MSWDFVKLSDCCISISDGDHQPPPKADEGIPFVTISDITSYNQFNFENVMYVPDEYYESLDEKRKARMGDVLYSVVGSYGIPILIKEPQKFVFQRHIAILRPNTNVDSRYLYYAMKNPTFYAHADSVAIGAAQKTISLSALKDLKIPLPPLPIQRRIADILSAYDDLIENNQRQIKLLEEAAMRLYREWFVFMRFPGHESVRIVDGVPEGWEKKCLRHLISYEIGGGWGNDNESSGFDIRTWVIRGTDIDGLSSGQIHSIPLRFNKQQTLSSRMLSHGDIIFEVSGGSKNVGVAKSYLITQPLIDYLGHPVICASFCKMIRPISLDYAEYLYSTLRHLRDSGITEEYELKSASSIINFKWADFLDLHFVLIPPETIMHAFNDCISPIYTKIVSMSIQVETLQKARDALLPRLMNGGEGLKLEGGAV